MFHSSRALTPTPRLAYTDYSPPGPWVDGASVVRNYDGVGFTYNATLNTLTVNPNKSASIKDANSFIVKNLPTPTNTGDAANKAYVDSHSGSGGITDAPNDGQQYGRQSLAWSVVVPNPAASGTTPAMDGTGAAGSATVYARGDHVHPTDTSRAPTVSPTFTGTPAAPTATAGTSTTQLATTAFVGTAVTNATVSPVFTGDPQAPTASPGDNDTSIATTAFVVAAIAGGVGTAGAVVYNASQSLSAAQKAQAQSNIKLTPTIQKFTTGSGTYTTPTGVAWIRVRMVGGGGGGIGGGTSNTAGTSGGNTTFGLHTANGGASSSSIAGGIGGSGTIGAGAVGIVIPGNGGGGGQAQSAANQVTSAGPSGGTIFGGGASSPGYAAGGAVGATNTGAGGGGGGNNNVTGSSSGGGGGGGGGLDIIIAAPVSTYSYAVGTAGGGGAGAGGGFAGGNGAVGQIVVEEYYGS